MQPVDNTGLKAFIDSNLPDSPPGQPRKITPSVLRAVFYRAVDWIQNAVNSNVSTWLRTSDGQPVATNTDDVYRTGVTRFKGGIEAYTKNTKSQSLGEVPNDQAGMRISAQNGGPAYMELHHPGIRIDKIGTDGDGVLKYGPWGSGAAYAIMVDSLTNAFRLSNAILNRKIILNQVADNDHQYYGFGINNSTLRYQVDTLTSRHAFYAGASPASSALLMIITGSGRVGIGTETPGYKLDVQADNPTDAVLAQFQNTRLPGGIGALVQIHQAGIGIWRFGVAGGADAFVIQGYGGGAFPERMRIDTVGNMGVGTTAPTARLHVKSANGYDQLRLENKYTPSGPNDPNGQPGAMCWDDTWFYLKTTVGWRRWQLQSW